MRKFCYKIGPVTGTGFTTMGARLDAERKLLALVESLGDSLVLLSEQVATVAEQHPDSKKPRYRSMIRIVRAAGKKWRAGKAGVRC